MSLYVLDTDTVTLHRRRHAQVCQKVASRRPAELAVAVLTVEEQLSGWYRLLRKTTLPPQVAQAYQELADAVHFFSLWQILPYSVAAIAYYDRLRALKLNVRKMDLRIAAVTLEHGGILVTRNLRDFRRVPNLVIEDWSL